MLSPPSHRAEPTVFKGHLFSLCTQRCFAGGAHTLSVWHESTGKRGPLLSYCREFLACVRRCDSLCQALWLLLPPSPNVLRVMFEVSLLLRRPMCGASMKSLSCSLAGLVQFASIADNRLDARFTICKPDSVFSASARDFVYSLTGGHHAVRFLRPRLLFGGIPVVRCVGVLLHGAQDSQASGNPSCWGWQNACRVLFCL